MSAKKTGRPTKLTGELADRLVDLLEAGTSTTAAAAELGVTRRTIQHWRRRAWSRDPADQPYVALERRLRPAREHRAPEVEDDWRAAARELEQLVPERWALPEFPLDAA